jgi:O-antigen/teichoic acid export membrane protein
MQQSVLFKSIFWVYVFSYVGLPITYLARVIYSHQLSLEEFGALYAFLGLFAILAVFNDFGFSEAINYFGAKTAAKNDHQKLKNTIWYAVLVQLTMATIVVSILGIFSAKIEAFYFKTHISNATFNLLLMYYFTLCIMTPLRMSMLARSNAFAFSCIEFIRLSIILAASSLIFIFPDKLSAVGLAWGLGSLAALIAAFVWYYATYKDIQDVQIVYNPAYFKEMGAYALGVIASSGALILISMIDLQILTMFTTLSDVAIYSNALALAGVIHVLSHPIVWILYPLAAKLAPTSKRLINIITKTFQAMLLLVTPVVVAFTVFSRELMLLFFGEKFSEGAILLSVLCIGFLFYTLSAINLALLGALGKVSARNKLLYSVILFNLIANIIVVQFAGALGVAIVTAFSYAFMQIGGYFMVTKHISLKISSYAYFAKLIFLNATFLGVLALSKKIIILPIIWEGISVALIGGIWYIIIALTLKLITRELIIKTLKQVKQTW